MAIINDSITGQPAGVDPLHKALRTSLKPNESLGWNSIGVQSGLLTAVAANGAVFSFRNISANPIIIRRVGVGFLCSTPFTAAQKVDFALMIARAFTASDTGGTAIALIGNNGKHRTSLGTPTSVDMRISTTAALTAGTKTLDTNTVGIVGSWVGAAGTIINTAQDNLLSHAAGDHPIVLSQNEGINIQNLTLMGAAGVGTLYVNIEFAEVSNY
jgi:hypothetical protein